MIGYLQGTAAGDVVVVAGVGYLVHTPTPLPDGAQVTLWVSTIVRENDISLYGFASRAERELFGYLLKAPGVGGKVALGLLALGTDVLARALTGGDAAVLARAPGIGVKRAQSVLGALSVPAALLDELAGTDAPLPELPLLTQLTEALTALGFRPEPTRAALERHLAAGLENEQELMRAAMSELRSA